MTGQIDQEILLMRCVGGDNLVEGLLVLAACISPLNVLVGGLVKMLESQRKETKMIM